MAVGGVDDTLEHVAKVAGVEVLLGDGDELEVLGEEASDQGHTEPVERSLGELGAVRHDVVETTDGLCDIGE